MKVMHLVFLTIALPSMLVSCDGGDLKQPDSGDTAEFQADYPESSSDQPGPGPDDDGQGAAAEEAEKTEEGDNNDASARSETAETEPPKDDRFPQELTPMVSSPLLFSEEIAKQREQLEEIAKQREQLQDVADSQTSAVVVLLEEVNACNAECQAAQAKIAELQRENNELSAQFISLTGRNEDVEKTSAAKQRDLEATKSDLDAKESEIQEKLATIADLKAQLDNQNDQIAELVNQKSAVESKLNETQSPQSVDYSSVEAKVARLEQAYLELLNGLPKDLESYAAFAAKYLNERQDDIEADLNNGNDLTAVLTTLEKMAQKLNALKRVLPNQATDQVLAVNKQIGDLYAKIKNKIEPVELANADLSWGEWVSGFGTWALSSVWGSSEESEEDTIEKSPKVLALLGRLGQVEQRLQELYITLTESQPEDQEQVKQQMVRAVLEGRVLEAQLAAQEQFDRAEALKKHHAENLTKVQERLQSEIDFLTVKHEAGAKNLNKANELRQEAEEEHQAERTRLLAELLKQEATAMKHADTLESKINQRDAELAQADEDRDGLRKGIVTLTGQVSELKEELRTNMQENETTVTLLENSIAKLKQANDALAEELEPYRVAKAKREAMIEKAKNLPSETLETLKDIFTQKSTDHDFTDGLDDHNLVGRVSDFVD